MANQIIVVGGGLSGLSAAHTILEHGLNVLVIDKNAFFGGNSTKATSGINGALTKTQIRKFNSPLLSYTYSYTGSTRISSFVTLLFCCHILVGLPFILARSPLGAYNTTQACIVFGIRRFGTGSSLSS